MHAAVTVNGEPRRLTEVHPVDLIGEDAALKTQEDVNECRVSESIIEKYLYTDESKEEYAKRLKDQQGDY